MFFMLSIICFFWILMLPIIYIYTEVYLQDVITEL